MKDKFPSNAVKGDSFALYLSGYGSDIHITLPEHKKYGAMCGKCMIKGERKYLKKKFLPSKWEVDFIFTLNSLPGKWKLEYSNKDTGTLTRIA